LSSRATEHGSLSEVQDAVRRISDHAVALARLEADLAKTEIATKGKRLGTAAGLGAGAAVLGVLALGVALAAAAAALALVLPLWGALLVVAGATLAVAAVLAGAARAAAKRATPPVPEQAIEEARWTKQALTGASNGG
jgi:Flp pilus assembly protein TadB